MLMGVSWAADKDQSDIAKRIDASANVLNEIMATPDKAIPDKVMRNARCVAVVPSMVKIAIGFGGNHGKGVATCRTETGWSAPAPITITGGSFGLQLGGQAIDLVMIVTNDQGMQHLLSSKFKLGADASAAAGPGWARCCGGYRHQTKGGSAHVFPSARPVCWHRSQRSVDHPRQG